MKEYELGVILHPDLEIDQDKATDKVEKQIASLKGKVKDRDFWGKRKLAYPIAKQNYGLYCFFRVELDPESVAELERGLQISNEVIRYLVVVYEPPQQPAESESETKEPTDKDDQKATDDKVADDKSAEEAKVTKKEAKAKEDKSAKEEKPKGAKKASAKEKADE